jgi:hypothetical protein
MKSSFRPCYENENMQAQSSIFRLRRNSLCGRCRASFLRQLNSLEIRPNLTFALLLIGGASGKDAMGLVPMLAFSKAIVFRPKEL